MDFLSSDGFPVTLDGAVEFRVFPDRAAEVFVKYNEDDNGDAIDGEIIAKVITPESRSSSVAAITGLATSSSAAPIARSSSATW